MPLATAAALLLASLACGLAAFWATVLICLLPPFAGWTQAGKRPWACDTCMSSWTSLLSTLVVATWWAWPDLLWTWPVAAGAALLIVTIYGRLQQGASDFVLPEEIQ